MLLVDDGEVVFGHVAVPLRGGSEMLKMNIRSQHACVFAISTTYQVLPDWPLCKLQSFAAAKAL